MRLAQPRLDQSGRRKTDNRLRQAGIECNLRLKLMKMHDELEVHQPPRHKLHVETSCRFFMRRHLAAHPDHVLHQLRLASPLAERLRSDEHTSELQSLMRISY